MTDQRLTEAVLLENITTPEKFRDLIEKGITDKSFVIYPHVFSFIESYIKDFNKAPELDLLRATAPDFTPSNIQYTDYFIESILDNELHRNIENILGKGIETLNVSPKGALTYLLDHLGGMHKTTIRNIPRSFTDRDALERLQKVSTSAGTKKYSAGFATLSKYLDYYPGVMTGVVGRISQGKSTIALYMGCCAYEQGARVLFISPEMTRMEVNYRWDTFMMRKYMKDTIPNTALHDGKGVDLQKYKSWLDRASQRSDWVTYDAYSTGKAFTVTNIGLLIEEHTPDVVIVDGLMLLKEEEKIKGSWEKVHALSYGLKELVSTKEIAMIVTNQINREGATAEIPGLENISYGDGFGQAVDKVLTITPGPVKTQKHIRLMKNRLGPTMDSAVLINMDVEQGIIGE